MHLLLEILLTLVVGVGGIAVGGTALFLRRLNRANRLVLDHPSPAPTQWLWSWRRGAVLHRRLRRLCQVARQSMVAAPGPPPPRWRRRPRPPMSPLARVGGELVGQAIALDSRLVVADRLGGSWRRPALAALEAEVRRLEQSAQRLVGLSAAWESHLSAVTVPAAPQVPDLQDQLDAVEAAMGELGATRHWASPAPRPHGPLGATGH